MKKILVSILFGLSLLCSYSVHAQDQRIRTVTYTDKKTITIHAGLGLATLITFGENEAITFISAGDSKSWEIRRNNANTLVSVKPLTGNTETNLNVVTDKRIYSLLLISSQAPEHKSSFQVRFKYPDDVDDATMRKQAELSASNPNQKNFNMATANYNYYFAGDKALKPRAVFDDGVKTFIEPNGEVPAVFVVGPNRHESVVNFRMEGRFMVIDKVARQFTLRAGKSVLCLYNNRQSYGVDPVARDYAPLPAQSQSKTKWW